MIGKYTSSLDNPHSSNLEENEKGKPTIDELIEATGKSRNVVLRAINKYFS